MIKPTLLKNLSPRLGPAAFCENQSSGTKPWPSPPVWPVHIPSLGWCDTTSLLLLPPARAPVLALTIPPCKSPVPRVGPTPLHPRPQGTSCCSKHHLRVWAALQVRAAGRIQPLALLLALKSPLHHPSSLCESLPARTTMKTILHPPGCAFALWRQRAACCHHKNMTVSLSLGCTENQSEQAALRLRNQEANPEHTRAHHPARTVQHAQLCLQQEAIHGLSAFLCSSTASNLSSAL